MLKKQVNSFLVNSLLNSQIHIGKKTNKWSKTLNYYLFGIRHEIFFFNVKKIHIFLKRLVFFLYNSIINHKSCLFIGTDTLIHPLINYIKFSLNQPSVNIGWVGGTLTTWFTIRNYAKFLYSKNVLKKTFSRFELKSVDKISQKIHRYIKMKAKLKGLERASQFPNIIICLEKQLNEFALHETFLLRLPLICFISNNEHFSNITFPIVGNTTSFESFNFYLNLILNSIKKGFIKRRLTFLRFNYSLLQIQKGLKFRSKKSLKTRKSIQNLMEFDTNMNQYSKFFIRLNIRGFCYYRKLFILLNARERKRSKLHNKKIRGYRKRDKLILKNANK